MIERRGTKIREEYAEWLSEYNFDCFFTATFDKNKSLTHTGRREPYYAIKNVWNELAWYNVERGFLVAEPHQSGDLHIHGIIAGGLPQQKTISLPWSIEAGLRDKFGIAKVEAPRHHECVTMYCAKYLLKQQHRACDYYEVFGDKVYWHASVLQKSALEREAIRQGAEYV
jgi:hypothetical protein